MHIAKILITIAAALLMLPSAANALPDTAGELRAIIESDYGGDANAYVTGENGDFRRMACRGRADLIQQLLDEGLIVGNLPYRTLERFYQCAMDEAEWDGLALIIEPQTLARVERDANSTGLPLQHPVYTNDYQGTLLLLVNGAHQIDNRGWTRGVFTKDGHRFLAVEWAVRQDYFEVIKAFEDAGYEDIVTDARIPGLRALLYQLATGNDAGGGFLPVVVDLALGVALGGSNTDFLFTLAGGSFVDSLLGNDEGGERSLSSEGIEMQRKLSRYLTSVDAPIEKEPAPKNPASALTATKPLASTSLSAIEELERLADLRDRGVISEEEFEIMKTRIFEAP
jgi:hypothetical protein